MALLLSQVLCSHSLESQREIRALSQTYTTIKYLTEYIFEGFKQIKAEYESMKSNSKIYIDKFQSVLLENDGR